MARRAPKHAAPVEELAPVTVAPTQGFPKNPPEDLDVPTIEGVRLITQDPNFDPNADEEVDAFSAPITKEEDQ